MTNIEIRRAEERDRKAVRELLQAYWKHLAEGPAGIYIAGYEEELAELPGSYAEPAGVILLAVVNGDGAGCVAFRPIRRESCEMKRLWVGSEFRGLRLGLRLIEAGIGWARETGYEAMYLDTVPAAMPEANALYLRLGFQPVDRYNDNPVTDVQFFRLTL